MSARRMIRVALALAASSCIGIVAAQQSMPGMQMPVPAASTPVPSKPATRHHAKTHLRPAPKPATATHDVSMQDMPGMAPSTPSPATSASDPRTAKPANDHIAPSAPAHAMAPMSPLQMTDVMQMDDQATRGMWLMDRLERTRSTDGSMATEWETDAWWGTDIDKLWLRSEGETDDHGTRDARAELLWDHAFSTFWNGRLGARDDFGSGPGRQWMALGVHGLAPYWFDLGATLYAGPQGRTAARLEASYDLRFTQRLILTPDLELNFYGKNDPRRDVHAGLSDGELGLRLRYDISRRFAPYLGVNWTYRHGDAPLFPAPVYRLPAHELTWLLGVRFWF